MKILDEQLAKRHAEFYRTTGARTIVMVRMGDFYETIGTDAMLIADVCDLSLTEKMWRDATSPSGGWVRLLAGFPHVRLEEYRRMLAASGWDVLAVELHPTSEECVGAA